MTEPAIRSVIGHSFSRVAYLSSPGLLPCSLDGFDVVPQGVELVTASDDTFSVVWSTDDYTEALRFAPGKAESLVGAQAPTTFDRWDMTDSPQWQPLMSERVVDVGIGWQASSPDPLETVWAVRLDFGAERNILIALGAPNPSGGIRFHAETIVVVFDEGLGRSYEVRAQTSSPWEV